LRALILDLLYHHLRVHHLPIMFWWANDSWWCRRRRQ